MRLKELTGRLSFWLTWPGLWVYLKIGKRSRVLVVAEDQVLVVKSWLGTGKWSVPGGGIHYKEESKTGALRELAEETGLKLTPNQLKYLGSNKQTIYGLSFNCECFAASLAKPLPISLTDPEILDIQWLPISKLNNKNANSDVLDLLKASDLTGKPEPNLVK